VWATPTDYHDRLAAYIDPANMFDNGTVTVSQHTYSSWDTASAHLLV